MNPNKVPKCLLVPSPRPDDMFRCLDIAVHVHVIEPDESGMWQHRRPYRMPRTTAEVGHFPDMPPSPSFDLVVISSDAPPDWHHHATGFLKAGGKVLTTEALKEYSISKPATLVTTGNGNVLQRPCDDGKTPDMNDPVEFIIAFGQARYGTTEWIGPTARELSVNPKFIADCISGKSYLKPNNTIISDAVRILDEEIARLQAARQKAPT